VALTNIVAVNLYLAIYKKLLRAAGVFLATVTIPVSFVSFLSVSNYVNGLPVSLPPLPIVPVESLYIVLVFCALILGLSAVPSLKPQMLRKMFATHQKRQLATTLPHSAADPKDDSETKKEKGKGGENGNGL